MVAYGALAREIEARSTRRDRSQKPATCSQSMYLGTTGISPGEMLADLSWAASVLEKTRRLREAGRGYRPTSRQPCACNGHPTGNTPDDWGRIVDCCEATKQQVTKVDGSKRSGEVKYKYRRPDRPEMRTASGRATPGRRRVTSSARNPRSPQLAFLTHGSTATAEHRPPSCPFTLLARIFLPSHFFSPSLTSH